MALKKNTAAVEKKAPKPVRLDEEWSPSVMDKPALEKLVEAGLLKDEGTAGWRPAAGELYPMPNTNELVVFEGFFERGFGVPIHPFLRKLIRYWGVSLCNLHPNTILHVSIYIDFCESYLGILPHFNLFCHLFVLKKRGGSRSRVCGGVYLQLREGMIEKYISAPLNTSLKGGTRGGST